MDVTQLALTWVGGQTVKNLFDLRENLISTKVSASQRKSTQVHARPCQTESQVDSSFQLASTDNAKVGRAHLCCHVGGCM